MSFILTDFRNPDGTYNGVKFMAKLTGLSEAEIAWTWRRMSELMFRAAMPKEDAMRIVKEEAKGKPWEA